MIARMRLGQIIPGEERKDKRNLREKGDDISSFTGKKKASGARLPQNQQNVT